MSVSDVERVFFATMGRAEIDAWVADLVEARLGTDVEEIVLRSGRIDAVYGLRLGDGRSVLAKVHRPPVDHAGLLAGVEVLAHLHRHGYPCPEPIDGPVLADGRTVSIQSLLGDGEVRDAELPDVRRAMAESQAEHIAILRRLPDLDGVAGRLSPRPAWSAYAAGPWPVPHDPIFDFSATPPGWEWLDRFAAEATADLARLRADEPPVMGHGDWYAGNLRFADEKVVAVFDWDLIVDDEAVVVGLSSGGYLATEAPSPEAVDAYLTDYGRLRPTVRDQRPASVAAARWMLAFNARCDLAFLSGEPAPGSALHQLVTRREDYLALGRT